MLNEAVKILRQGGVVAFPTETVYGLGADATNPKAVQRIFEIKGRPSTNPLIVHVADESVARRYARNWPEVASNLARRFWPGPLTIVVPKNPIIVDGVTAGLDTVGLRAPNHPLALELLRQFDGPICAPSANRSTHISPTTAQHVREELGDSVDLLLDGGPCAIGIESTVLDLSTDVPTILRPGAITREQIEQVIGSVRMISAHIDAHTAMKSPGQQSRHYAPRAPAYWFDTSHHPTPGQNNIALILLGDSHFTRGSVTTLPRSPEQYARLFYAVLREIDQANPDAIHIEMPPDAPEWHAVRDRISRAARPLSQ
jgi:L-threonylcarbamoyladenylate synthase